MGAYLLTGAGSGIGAALADLLHGRGEDLVLVARSAERADELAAAYPGAQVLTADLARPEEAEGLADRLPSRLDAVVHSAGIVALGDIADLDLAQWRSTLEVNLLAPVALTRAALPALRAARGRVVLVNSGQGLSAAGGWGSYAASKHGLKAFADSLRQEERPHGIQVISVYPGRTATPMQEAVHAHEGEPYDPTVWTRPESVAATILHALDGPRDAALTDITVRPGG